MRAAWSGHLFSAMLVLTVLAMPSHAARSPWGAMGIARRLGIHTGPGYHAHAACPQPCAPMGPAYYAPTPAYPEAGEWTYPDSTAWHRAPLAPITPLR